MNDRVVKAEGKYVALTTQTNDDVEISASQGKLADCDYNDLFTELDCITPDTFRFEETDVFDEKGNMDIINDFSENHVTNILFPWIRNNCHAPTDTTKTVRKNIMRKYVDDYVIALEEYRDHLYSLKVINWSLPVRRRVCVDIAKIDLLFSSLRYCTLDNLAVHNFKDVRHMLFTGVEMLFMLRCEGYYNLHKTDRKYFAAYSQAIAKWLCGGSLTHAKKVRHWVDRDSFKMRNEYNVNAFSVHLLRLLKILSIQCFTLDGIELGDLIILTKTHCQRAIRAYNYAPPKDKYQDRRPKVDRDIIQQTDGQFVSMNELKRVIQEWEQREDVAFKLEVTEIPTVEIPGFSNEVLQRKSIKVTCSKNMGSGDATLRRERLQRKLSAKILNFKGKLLEECAKHKLALPTFIFSKEGEDHIPSFVCTCKWNKYETVGKKPNKKNAEQDACKEMLSFVENYIEDRAVQQAGDDDSDDDLLIEKREEIIENFGIEEDIEMDTYKSTKDTLEDLKKQRMEREAKKLEEKPSTWMGSISNKYHNLTSGISSSLSSALAGTMSKAIKDMGPIKVDVKHSFGTSSTSEQGEVEDIGKANCIWSKIQKSLEVLKNIFGGAFETVLQFFNDTIEKIRKNTPSSLVDGLFIFTGFLAIVFVAACIFFIARKGLIKLKDLAYGVFIMCCDLGDFVYTKVESFILSVFGSKYGEDSAEMQLGGAVGGGLIALLSATIFGGDLDIKKVERFNKLTYSGRTITDLISWAIENCGDLINHAAEATLGRPVFSERVFVKNVYRVQEEWREMIMKPAGITKIVRDPAIVEEMEALILEAMKYHAQVLSTKALSSEEKRLYAMMLIDMRKWRQEIHAFDQFGKPRRPATHVNIIGATSTGKSYMTKHFMSILYALNKRWDVDLKSEQFSYAMAYERNAGDEFWSGYHGQWALTVQDWLQSSDDITRSTQALEHIAICGNQPYPLPVAELELKGNTYCDSKLYLTTSNVIGLPRNLNLADPIAFMRRTDFTILPVVREEFAKPTIKYKSDMLTIERNGEAKVSPWKRQIDMHKLSKLPPSKFYTAYQWYYTSEYQLLGSEGNNDDPTRSMYEIEFHDLVRMIDDKMKFYAEVSNKYTDAIDWTDEIEQQVWVPEAFRGYDEIDNREELEESVMWIESNVERNFGDKEIFTGKGVRDVIETIIRVCRSKEQLEAEDLDPESIRTTMTQLDRCRNALVFFRNFCRIGRSFKDRYQGLKGMITSEAEVASKFFSLKFGVRVNIYKFLFCNPSTQYYMAEAAPGTLMNCCCRRDFEESNMLKEVNGEFELFKIVDRSFAWNQMKFGWTRNVFNILIFKHAEWIAANLGGYALGIRLRFMRSNAAMWCFSKFICTKEFLGFLGISILAGAVIGAIIKGVELLSSDDFKKEVLTDTAMMQSSHNDKNIGRIKETGRWGQDVRYTKYRNAVPMQSGEEITSGPYCSVLDEKSKLHLEPFSTYEAKIAEMQSEFLERRSPNTPSSPTAEFISKIARNYVMMKFIYHDGFSHMVRGFFIGGTVCFVPGHGLHTNRTLVKIALNGDVSEGGKEFGTNEYKLNSYMEEGEDLIRIVFNGKCKNFPSLANHIWDFRDDLRGAVPIRIDTVDHVIHRYVGLRFEFWDELNTFSSNSGGVEFVSKNNVWVQGIKGHMNDCGFVYFADSNHVQHKIIGMHSAGHHNMGAACTVFKRKHLEGLSKSEMASLGDMDKITRQSFIGLNLSPRMNGCLSYGNLIRPVVAPMETRIKPSAIMSSPSPWPITKAPARLRPVGDESPLWNALSGYDHVGTPAFSPALVEAMMEPDTLSDVMNYWSKTTPLKKLTLKEAVIGTPHLETGGVEWKTSSGLALKSIGEKKYDSIKVMKDGKYVSYPDINPMDINAYELELSDRLEGLFEHYYTTLKNGEVPRNLAEGILKDELRTFAKVQSCQTRLFKATGLVAQLIHKQTFADFVSRLMFDRYNCPIKVGINVHGHEWRLFYDQLKSMAGGKYAGGGDVKRWDISMKVFFTEAFYQFYKELAPDDEEWELYLIIRSLMQPTVFFPIGVYEPWEEVESGGWMTAIINSLINHWLHKTIWKMLAPPEERYNFKIHVVFGVYGDDSIWTRSEKATWWTMTNIAAALLKFFNITYTNPFKTGEMMDHIALEDMVFLKRSFRLEGGQVFPALDKESIQNSVMYTMKGKTEEEEHKATYDCCKTALIEAFYHGREYFDFVRTKLVPKLKAINRSFVIPFTYDSLYTQWMTGYMAQ